VFENRNPSKEKEKIFIFERVQEEKVRFFQFLEECKKEK
jgi:hypothetical protein